jgi:hypothetical protein
MYNYAGLDDQAEEQMSKPGTIVLRNSPDPEPARVSAEEMTLSDYGTPLRCIWSILITVILVWIIAALFNRASLRRRSHGASLSHDRDF